MVNDVSTWDAEQTALMFEASLPEVACQDPMALKTKVSEQIRKMNLDGAKLLELMRLTNSPDQPPLMQQPVFQELFAGTEHLFQMARTHTRHAVAFADTIFKKIIFSSTMVSDIGKELLNTDMNEFRDPSHDAIYAADEKWCIAVGMPSLFEYDSTVCRPGDNAKAVHGFQTCPAGWIRLALKPHHHTGSSSKEEMFKTWHKAYHGTDVRNVQSIMTDSLKQPKRSIHGTAGANGKSVIYCSPCIEYSAHYLFTGDAQVEVPAFESSGDGSPSSRRVQCVFEVRVNPLKYRVQGNTLNKKLWPNWFLDFDSTCNSKNLEWIVENAEDIEVTGILIRELTCSPKEWNEKRVERMEKIVGWQWDMSVPKDSTKLRPGKATRSRDDDGVPAGQAKWQWNGVDGSKHTLSRDASLPWIDYPPDISAVLEEAYCSYQQYCYIGQPAGSPGPYYIDFQGWCEGHGGPIQKRADSDNKQSWRQRSVRRVPKA